MNELVSYGHSFQIKVLYSLLNDKQFLQNISEVVTTDYFETPAHKWIVELVLRYYREYHTYPTMEVIKVEMKKEKNEVLRVSIKEELKQAYETTEEDIEYVKKEFFNFCKNQRMKETLLTSVDFLEAGHYDDIWRLMENTMKISEEQEEIHDYEDDVETRYREDLRNPVPFPWQTLTNITDGGAGGGDLVIPISNPKGGKSWICTAIGGNAAQLGYNVLHYTLELSESYVGKRYDAYFTGIDVDQLTHNRERVEKVAKDLKGRIKIKAYPPGRATLTMIERHIRRLKNTHNFVPDVIIIDYLEKLRNTKDRKDRTEDANDVFTDAKGLAVTLNKPIISPAQTNRTASGIDIIRGEHMAGTYEKLMIADIIFSVSKKSNIWYIMGNRYGDDDLAFKSKFNRKNGHIILDEKPYDENEMTLDQEEEVKTKIQKKFMRMNNA